MMKISTIISILFFCSSTYLFSQGRYLTKTGELIFEASVPSFEEVKAKNVNVSAILNSDTGEFAALALVKGFRFKVALMEEHFNENYMESSKFSKATFKGKIKDFDLSELSKKQRQYVILGTITIHGEDKVIETPITISLIDDAISLQVDFILKPEDFNIEIPKIVSSKVAKEVEVSGRYLLKK